MQKGRPSGEANATLRARILVDDEAVQTQVMHGLESLHISTRCYRDETEFLANDSAAPPSCVILACQLDGPIALNFVARCRAQWPKAGILLIAENPPVSLAVAAMRSGVDGILEKPINSDDLVREVQTVIKQSQSSHSKQHERDEARQLLTRISDTEREILEFVANGVPNKNIAAEMSLSLRTVEKYRHSLFQNLGVESAAEAARIWVLASIDD